MPDYAVKPIVYIPDDLLEASEKWEIGQTYKVKLVVKQISKDEEGATFEIIDASSLENPNKGQRSNISSDSGSYMGKG